MILCKSVEGIDPEDFLYQKNVPTAACGNVFYYTLISLQINSFTLQAAYYALWSTVLWMVSLICGHVSL